ncbi:MAG: Ig-like domain-containing protein, partial [Candidatus Binatia bacterium]
MTPPPSPGAARTLTATITDPGADTQDLTWDFGDGVVLTHAATMVTHVFSVSSTVTLTVTDDDGGVGTATAAITVPPLRVDGPVAARAAGEGLTSDAILSLLTEARASWSVLGVDPAPVDWAVFEIVDLPGDLIGSTERYPAGQALVRLDVDAAGHGWFVDPTPGLADEFSAVGVSEYLADGGAAATRVDLLTVMAHELGHVLGLGHAGASAPQSVMSPVLADGIRRLPTPDDLALRSDDVFGAETLSAIGVRNGDFSISDPAAIGFGWTLRGDAVVQFGRLELREDLRLQSGARQSFLIPTGATALQFDLVDVDFDAPGFGPLDAFEVALLDAVSMAPIAGTADLTETDALLNIQASGRIRTSAAVTLDGVTGDTLPADLTTPITVTIDLAGIAPGHELSLYFDLLGFGATGSRVIIDSVQFLAGEGNNDPVANDDTFVAAEDTPAVLDVLGNDTDPDGDTLSAAIVSGPGHGTLSANADGTLTYL